MGRNSLNILTGVPNMFNIAHGTTIVMHEVNRLLFPFAAICSGRGIVTATTLDQLMFLGDLQYVGCYTKAFPYKAPSSNDNGTFASHSVPLIALTSGFSFTPLYTLI